MRYLGIFNIPAGVNSPPAYLFWRAYTRAYLWARWYLPFYFLTVYLKAYIVTREHFLPFLPSPFEARR
ncbi:MAG TPA: hypothetical protein VHY36_11135 [Steroidobacteraceae bacterium]|jgi:hypothetical protein|nr:hypothetical protein [Steroidobacteraceae bacterium]